MKNKFYLLTIANAILIVGLVSFLFFKSFYNSPKIIYVDNVKLFDGFNMTKQMKQIGEKEFNAQKTILDSLYAKIQSDKISAVEKKQLMPEFIQRKEGLEQFNQNFASQETLKIWSRIHSYIEEYSKETDYELILGSQNKQTVFYANEKVDKTDELLAYINKKYEGIK